MKCDDFLRSIRTGNSWRRMLARLHAARCRRCAALQNGLTKMETELSRTTPITAAQRRLWEQAMEAEADERPRAPVRLRLAAALGAAALVAVAVIAWQWIGGSQEAEGPVAESDQGLQTAPGLQEASPEEAVPSQELAEMRAGLDKLSAELDQLSRKAVLLKARRQVAELIERYEKL